MTSGSPIDADRPVGYIPTLDGWRTIAVVLVVFAHVVGQYCAPGDSAGWCAIRHSGDHGVSLFFGLSGFLICTRLLEERQATGRISLRRFYARRVFRIFPAAFTYLAVVGALGALGAIAVSGQELFASVAFFRNYIPAELPGSAGWYTGHFWSLAVEEHFYLVWPLLLVLLRPRRALVAAVALGVLTVAWRRVVAHHDPVAQLLGLPWQLLSRTDTRLDAMLAGCGLALLLDHPTLRRRIVGILDARGWTTIAAAYVAVVVTYGRQLTFEPALLAETLLVPPLIVGTALNPSWRVSRALEAAPMRLGGRLSYSIYLWQQLFLATAGVATIGWPQRMPWNLAALGLAVLGSYYLVERPAIRMGHRVARGAPRGRPEDEPRNEGNQTAGPTLVAATVTGP